MFHPLTGRIESLLKQNNFWYETFTHEPVKTSEEASKVRTGYSLSQGAKALIIRMKKNTIRSFCMLVIPGGKKFDSEKVKKLLDTRDIRFATEEEISKITDGVKIGGIPPFGNLFNVKVYMDSSMLTNEKIIFNAGDRSFSIAMKREDYQKLVSPEIASIV